MRRWLIVAVVVLLLGAAAAAGGWWLGSGRWANAPGAVGVGQRSAETLVRAAGLVPQVRTAPSDTVPSGTVADSFPPPGARLLRGSEVDLVVSTGRPVVPGIAAGTSVEQARRQIIAAHLTPVLDAAADRHSDSVAVGGVVGTDPAADTPLSIDADVVMVRSTGPAPQEVPPVAGKTVDDAENKLLVAGFRLGPPEHAFSPTADDGTVLGTDPQEGRLVARGSAVSLLIAASITVPPVRGESSGQAVADLTRAGLTATIGSAVFDPDVDSGSVVSTDPQPGARIDPASPGVVVTLSDAVPVPDVTQGDIRAARDTLAGLGLQIEVTAMIGANGSSVIGQLPSAGRRVAPGSTVEVSAFP